MLMFFLVRNHQDFDSSVWGIIVKNNVLARKPPDLYKLRAVIAKEFDVLNYNKRFTCMPTDCFKCENPL